MCEECYRLFGVETRTDSRMRFTELSPAFGGAFLMPNQANKKTDPPNWLNQNRRNRLITPHKLEK